VGSQHGLIEVLARNLPGGTEEIHGNLSKDVRCSSVLYPSISRIEFYRFANLLVYEWLCQGLSSITEIKLSLCLIKHNIMKRRVEEVQLHAFLTSGLDTGELFHAPVNLPPRKENTVPLGKRLSGPHSRIGRCGGKNNHVCLPIIEIRSSSI
jgi:hypothetical protein